jgi:hypothetical protein
MIQKDVKQYPNEHHQRIAFFHNYAGSGRCLLFIAIPSDVANRKMDYLSEALMNRHDTHLIIGIVH